MVQDTWNDGTTSRRVVHITCMMYEGKEGNWRIYGFFVVVLKEWSSSLFTL